MTIKIRKYPLLVVFAVLMSLILYFSGSSKDLQKIQAANETGSSRLSELLGSEDADGYPMALQAHDFRFPDDHGPHPQYRNEWWYVTGNLDGEKGERFGYELTLFRFALSPQRESQQVSTSAWTTEQVYIGHFAISDAREGKFHVAQRYSRGAAGLAGAQAVPFRIWLDDWTIADSGDSSGAWRLHAEEDGVEIDLRLTSLKRPVLNGENGLSRKSSQAGNASYYYSLTRLRSEGEIRIGQRVSTVSGLSWLDREWGSSALSPNQVGWDWFALQLSDGSDLMFYNLRRMDGTPDPHSAGTITDAGGIARHLDNTEVDITVRDYWDSEQGGRYPSAWTLEIPRDNIRLEIEPIIRNQELITTVRYWEGAVDVQGESGEAEVTGRGYVELTGYAE